MKASTDGPSEYGTVAKVLHWAMFLLIAAQFIVGWTMPPIEKGTEPERLINLHLSLGAVLLLLVLVRVGWRLTHRPPPADEGTPAWQQSAAGITHLILYALIIVMTLTGWAASSVRDWPVTLFGAVLPHLLPAGTKLGFKSGDLHADLLSWVLLGLIGVHALAALNHHFGRHDSVLQRMLPSMRRQRSN